MTEFQPQPRPEWRDYFQEQDIPHTFGRQERIYRGELAGILRKNDALRTKTDKRIYVLGGFFPARDNIDAFHRLGSVLTPDAAQRSHYLDINPQPTRILTPDEAARFHQADLARIAEVFPASSVDMIVLDHVGQFLDDKALQALFDGLNKVLTPEGVAMMTMTNPRFTMLEKWARSRSMGVEVFPRKRKQREALIRPHLKAVDGSNYPFEGSFTATIHTLARKDSPYPEFDGMYSEYHIEEQMENATPIPLPVSSQAVSESA
jgi:hypothetical protein